MTVKGTRAEIVELLQRRGEMTVHELTEALALAPAALRRHLDILAGEGMVEYRSVKQATGRPYYAYRLGERAREQLSGGYARLMERLLLEAAAIETPAAAGRVLDSLFEGVSNRLVAEHRTAVHGATLAQRVESVTSALHEEGILDTWSRQADGYHLYNNACPHHRAARASHGLCCSSERRAISLLLDTDVQQVGCIAEGKVACEYIVHPTASDESAGAAPPP